MTSALGSLFRTHIPRDLLLKITTWTFSLHVGGNDAEGGFLLPLVLLCKPTEIHYVKMPKAFEDEGLLATIFKILISLKHPRAISSISDY